MDAHQRATAEKCMTASHGGTMSFPDVLRVLADAGFEGYLVDYRRGSNTYYLSDGGAFELAHLETPGMVAAEFKAATVEANIRKSQANAHSYREFCENVKNAGCAGYLVTILGRRVVYFGRTGQTHVEYFPN